MLLNAEDESTPPGWSSLVSIHLGQRLGRWIVQEELLGRHHAKPRKNPHGGVSFPRMFSLKCTVCGEIKIVKANEVRRFIDQKRNPDIVLKCQCPVPDIG